MAKKLPTPDKNEQILRAIAMKRESFFQLILANTLQNPSIKTDDLNPVVEASLKAADHSIELLYPIKAE